MELLFGKRDDDSSTPAPAPVYSGWRTVGGKTYYYDQYTNQPVTGIQSIDNKLYYFDANGVQQDATFGIDVSKYQSNIDWEQVKTAGVKFVIIRIGYRGYGSGALVLDPMFEQPLHQCPERGPQGGRLLLQSGSQRERGPGRSAGCAYVLNGRKLDYPIYFDTEPPAVRMAVPMVWASKTAPSVPSPSARKSRRRLSAGRLRLHPVVPQAHRPEPAEELQHLERPL